MPQVTWEQLPQEIKEKMLERQEAQYGMRVERMFLNSCSGGFVWGETSERYDFWCDIIKHGNFDTFYKRYPKKDNVLTASKEYKHYPEPVEMMVSDGKINWYKRHIIYELSSRFWALYEKRDDIACWVYAKPIPKKVALTAKDISEGKGVGVDPELIEFVNQ